MPDTCKWCYKPLTDPMSVQLGVGPSCFTHEKRQHEQLRDAVATAPHGVVYYGNMPAGAAAGWVTAINQVDGLKASRRTVRGDVRVYVQAGGDPRTLRRSDRWRSGESGS